MKVGIIGYRSWIAQELEKVLKQHCHVVVHLEKRLVQEIPECTFLFPGKVEDDAEGRANEFKTIRAALCSVTSPQQRIIFFGSRANGDDTEYGKHKNDVENFLWKTASDLNLHENSQIIVIKAPSVFGPNQPKSSMLFPQIRTQGTNIILLNPDKKRDFISVKCMATFLAKFAEPKDPEGYSWFEASTYRSHIPGQFSLTSKQLLDIYETFVKQ